MKMSNEKLSKITIDEKLFNDVFIDSYNENGYQINGIALFEFHEIADDSHIKTYEKLPNEIKKLDDNVGLIKQDNVSSYVKNNILKNNDYNEIGYDKMIKTIEENAPEKIKQDDIFGKMIEFENLEKFIEKLLIEKSQLIINNQRFHIATDYDLNCDYAKLYFESLV